MPIPAQDGHFPHSLFRLDLPKISPTDAANNQPSSLTLAWGASTGAASYSYCIDMIDDDACNATWISTGTLPPRSLLAACLQARDTGRCAPRIRRDPPMPTVAAMLGGLTIFHLYLVFSISWTRLMELRICFQTSP